MQHSHDPQEIARVGAMITDVERYNGIEPHSSRVAAFAQSSVEDRYFWHLGRGGASSVRALTPALFLEMFETWALSTWIDCESDLAEAKSNLKTHAPKAVAASVSGDKKAAIWRCITSTRCTARISNCYAPGSKSCR